MLFFSIDRDKAAHEEFIKKATKEYRPRNAPRDPFIPLQPRPIIEDLAAPETAQLLPRYSNTQLAAASSNAQLPPQPPQQQQYQQQQQQQQQRTYYSSQQHPQVDMFPEQHKYENNRSVESVADVANGDGHGGRRSYDHVNQIANSGSQSQGNTKNNQTSGKRKKKPSVPQSNSSVIAGQVGAGIGSSRNLTEPYEDAYGNIVQTETIIVKPAPTVGTRKSTRQNNVNNVASHSTYSMNRNSAGEVQIPIQRIDRFEYDPSATQQQQRGSQNNMHRTSNGHVNRRSINNNLNEYADPRVAYRLASTERL